MSKDHVWKDADGQPWTLESATDQCWKCGSTPDTHIPDCGERIGMRLIIASQNGATTKFKRVPHICGKPARTLGPDGRLRCVQHDRIARGLSGKWAGKP